jgi:hypothetical protein
MPNSPLMMRDISPQRISPDMFCDRRVTYAFTRSGPQCGSAAMRSKFAAFGVEAMNGRQLGLSAASSVRGASAGETKLVL